MARILEIHLIHSFPTSNMNSDDKGDPKEGTLGGVPRARIASAPIKNVARVSMAGMAHLAGTAPGPERLALVDGSAASSPVVVAGGDVPAPQVATIADQKVIRDAQLDRYLVAHKQFAGSSAPGVPSAFLRSATVDSASR